VSIYEAFIHHSYNRKSIIDKHEIGLPNEYGRKRKTEKACAERETVIGTDGQGTDINKLVKKRVEQ